MAEEFFDLGEVSACGFGEGGRAVPAVVDADGWQAGVAGVAFEPFGDQVGVPGPAVGAAEEQVDVDVAGSTARGRGGQPGGVRPCGAGGELVRGSPLAVGGEVGDGVGVQGDDPVAVSGFDFLVDGLVADDGELVGDGGGGGGEVDLVDAQADGFAAASRCWGCVRLRSIGRRRRRSTAVPWAGRRARVRRGWRG